MSERLEQTIVGTSVHSRAIRSFVERSARATHPILLLGEPGVGKELVARTIHTESSRREEPFLMIDCSLFYERELRREIFGYHDERPGAKHRKGLLEFARRGTCYLSRVEELTSELQAELREFLRVGHFRRLGDGRSVSSGVRLIFSSEKNLDGFVQGGLFDADLHRRLEHGCLRIAPLRERAEDILEFAGWLAAGSETASQPKMSFTPECLDALKCYPWPRNYDEVGKEIQRLVAKRVERIEVEDLTFTLASYWVGRRGDPEVREVVEELEACIREFQIVSRLDGDVFDGARGGEEWTSGEAKEVEPLTELDF